MISDFQFMEFIITNIDYNASPIDEDTENTFEFAYGLDKKEEVYTLSLLTKILNKQTDHKLEITIETKGKFMFSNECDLNDDDRMSIIKTNGSSILFPYIRSLVYNLTSADTHGNAIILPTINFNNVIEELDNRKIKEDAIEKIG